MRNSKKKAEWLEPFRWKPGQCGNPFGRPVKTPMSDRYLKALETKLPDEVRCKLGLPKGSTVGDAIARRLAVKALNGSVEAAREIADRVEGKPAQAVRLEGDALLPAPTFNIQFRGDHEQQPEEVSTQIPGHNKRLATDGEETVSDTADEG